MATGKKYFVESIPEIAQPFCRNETCLTAGGGFSCISNPAADTAHRDPSPFASPVKQLDNPGKICYVPTDSTEAGKDQ
jgi:hypothetical protein